jgi:hypothetical protein
MKPVKKLESLKTKLFGKKLVFDQRKIGGGGSVPTYIGGRVYSDNDSLRFN